MFAIFRYMREKESHPFADRLVTFCFSRSACYFDQTCWDLCQVDTHLSCHLELVLPMCVCVCDTEVINLSHCVLSLFSSFVYKSSPMSYLCIVPVEDIILFLVWRMYEFFTWLAHHHLSWGSKRMETFSHDWFENISHLCSWHSWLWWWSSCASSQHHHHLFRVLYVTKLMCFDNVLVC